MPNSLGKRYECATCQAQVLVAKGGDGTLECHGQAMELMQPKPLPASD